MVAPLLLLFASTFSFAYLDTTLASVESSVDAFYEETRFADYRAGGGDVETFAARARRLDGVAAVTTRTTVTLAVWVRDGRSKLQGQLVGVPQSPPTVDGYRVEQGRGIDPEQPNDVVIDTHTAEGLDLAPGATLRILGLGAVDDVTVRGVVASPEYVVPAANAQQLITAPGQLAVVFAPESFVAKAAGPAGTREVLVRYEPGASRERLDRRLEALAASTKAAIREPRADQPSNAMLQEELDGLGVARVLAPGLLFVLAVAVGGLALALGARTGVPRRDVLLGGLFATDLGVVAGLGVAVLTAGSITGALDIPVTQVTVPIGGIVVAIVLGGLAVGAAYRVARAASTERHPRPVGMALAGGAAALAVAAVVAPLGIVDSAEATLDRADRLEVVDAQVAFETPVGDAEIEQLLSVRGVATAEPVPSAVVQLARGSEGYETQLEAFEPSSKLARFETPDGRPQRLPRRGLLVPGPLADILRAQPGDDLTITLPGVSTFTMPMTARTSGALGNLVFASIPAVREALDAPPGDLAGGLFNVAAARFAPGADGDRIAREVTSSPNVATYVDVAADLDAFVGALPMLRVVSWSLLGIGAVVAILGALVAALAIVPGACRRDVVLELVGPGAVGALVGVALGIGAADRLVDALETPVVRLEPSLDASTVLAAVGVVIVVDLVVALASSSIARRHGRSERCGVPAP
jgi:putative ABC transport system permease protein